MRASKALVMAVALGIAALMAVPVGASSDKIRDEGITTTLPMSAYAGSASCAPCHQRQYEPWSASLKATFVAYSKDIGSIPGKWGKAPFDKNHVFLVVGRKTKVAYVDESWIVFPHEYRLDKGKWKDKPNWDGLCDYRQRCAPCHLTGINPWNKEFHELGVGCEACHGPGAAHVADAGAAPMQVPGKNTGTPMLETCRRCHNQRNNHYKTIEGFSGSYHK